MEDVVFVSERAVGKRKRQDDDDKGRKRDQVKDESSSDDDSSSSSESDDDSDDEPNARVENVMSTVRISTEPQAAQSQATQNTSIKFENQAGSAREGDAGNTHKHVMSFQNPAILNYLNELECAMRARLPQAHFINGAKVRRGREAMMANIEQLEHAARSTFPKEDLIRGVLGKRKTKKRWPIRKLEQRTHGLRNLRGSLATPLLPAKPGRKLYFGSLEPCTTTGSGSQTVKDNEAEAQAMRKEIATLKAEVEREKRNERKAARDALFAETQRVAYEKRVTKKEEAFSQSIKDKDLLLKVQRRTQQDLASKLARCEAELTGMKSSRTADSPHRASRDKEAVQKADEAAKAAQEKTKAMFAHYDVLQNKNSILIGKLTMMAQVGGFGNHGSTYRKELDTLKAPPLSELEEYKEE